MNTKETLQSIIARVEKLEEKQKEFDLEIEKNLKEEVKEVNEFVESNI